MIFKIKFYYLCVKGLTEGLMSEVSPHHMLTLTDYCSTALVCYCCCNKALQT